VTSIYRDRTPRSGTNYRLHDGSSVGRIRADFVQYGNKYFWNAQFNPDSGLKHQSPTCFQFLPGAESGAGAGGRRARHVCVLGDVGDPVPVELCPDRDLLALPLGRRALVG
jgi:hypothetical protein